MNPPKTYFKVNVFVWESEKGDGRHWSNIFKIPHVLNLHVISLKKLLPLIQESDPPLIHKRNDFFLPHTDITCRGLLFVLIGYISMGLKYSRQRNKSHVVRSLRALLVLNIARLWKEASHHEDALEWMITVNQFFKPVIY